MTTRKHILVVANVTAISDELLAALQARAATQPVTFHLIVPATSFGGGRAAARERVHVVTARMQAAGLHVDGNVADGDPIVAVSEVWDPKRYDEVIVSTLPMRVSKWLHAGLPERIRQLTGAPVTHVVSQPRKPPIEPTPAPRHHKSAIGPLAVLGWGSPKDKLDTTRQTREG